MKKCAVLYARINGHDKLRLDEQLQICREYAQGCGWHVVAELSDFGVSGLASESPRLTQALEMAQTGEFGVLIVHNVDRLSRDLTKILAIRKEFEQAGVKIKEAREW